MIMGGGHAVITLLAAGLYPACLAACAEFGKVAIDRAETDMRIDGADFAVYHVRRGMIAVRAKNVQDRLAFAGITHMISPLINNNDYY